MSAPDVQHQLAELQRQLSEAEEWANGLFLILSAVLPALLKDHPKAGQVADQLQSMERRYQELREHPERSTDPAEVAGHLEPAAMLYRQIALLGVWPDLDPRAPGR